MREGASSPEPPPPPHSEEECLFTHRQRGGGGGCCLKPESLHRIRLVELMMWCVAAVGGPLPLPGASSLEK